MNNSPAKTTNNWFYLLTAPNNGYFNMACDSYLLNSFIEENFVNPLLRLYSWNQQTLSIGMNQGIKYNNFENSYPIVKRLSGGQAVLHHEPEDELTYSVFLKSSKKAKTIYYEVGEVLLLFLREYGLTANFGDSNKNYKNEFDCFMSKTPADIVTNDIKIIGSAQYRKGIFIMQHGAIKLDLIRQLTGFNIQRDQAITDLKRTFQVQLNIDFTDYCLSSKDHERIELTANTYKSDIYRNTNEVKVHC